MGLREDIIEITDEVADAYYKYEVLDSRRKEFLNRYYSEKYGISIGDSVFQSGTGKRIIVDGFVQDGNVDDRPDLIGRLNLPFGLSKKPKLFKSNTWETASERRGEINGNLRNREDIIEINGNF